jgi:AcrR family transcriptional regulator
VNVAAERKNTETRIEDALNLAMNIIHNKGIHSLTLRRLADGLGISEAALFRHFTDKEEMIDRLASKVFNYYLVEEPTDDEDVEACFLTMMKGQFSSFQERPEATSVLFQEEIFREYTPWSKSDFSFGKAMFQTINLIFRQGRIERG